MNKHFTWAAVLALTLTGFAGTACSDDDNTGSGDNAYDSTLNIVYDELGILQNSLVTTDSTGAFVARVLGQPLDEADTTCVSVGVDDYKDAKQLFVGLFSDATVWNADSTVATFSDGKGIARLTRDGDAAGLVAKAEFDVPGLKYVSSVNFILNDAWPENAVREGDYVLGQTYPFPTWYDTENTLAHVVTGQVGAKEDRTIYIPPYKDDNGKEQKAQDVKTFANVMSDYVCIRPYKNGRPALLLQISHYKHKGAWMQMLLQTETIPSVEDAKEVSKVLQGDWDYYVAAFTLESGKELLNKDDRYWTSSGKTGFNGYQYDIYLSTGKTDYWYFAWSKTKWERVIYVKKIQ